MTSTILMLLVPATVVLALTIDLAAPSDLDVGERPQSRPPPRGTRLRADARGDDGGVRQDLAAGVVQLKPKTEV
jgi:hypothetical protein